MPAPKTEEDKVAELRRQQKEAKQVIDRYTELHREVRRIEALVATGGR